MKNRTQFYDAPQELKRSSHRKWPAYFAKFIEKHLCWSFVFNKVAGLSLQLYFFKRLWRRCLPVNFAKFLITPFYRTRPGDCFCKEKESLLECFLNNYPNGRFRTSLPICFNVFLQHSVSFKVSNKHTRRMYDVCPKSTAQTLDRHHLFFLWSISLWSVSNHFSLGWVIWFLKYRLVNWKLVLSPKVLFSFFLGEIICITSF